METLIKAYYTICSNAGIDGKKLLLERYGKTSAKDATRAELSELINELCTDGDKWRRRVMAAIGAKLQAEKRESNARIIKAIACRAAKAKSFNRIPHTELRAIYNQFSKPVKRVKNENCTANK